MAPDCNQVWISDGGGEGGSVVGRRTSPNLFIFERTEFLMKEHESLRGINQNNLTFRLAWSGT